MNKWKTGTYTWVSGWVELGNRKGKRKKMLCHSPRGFTERKGERGRKHPYFARSDEEEEEKNIKKWFKGKFCCKSNELERDKEETKREFRGNSDDYYFMLISPIYRLIVRRPKAFT